MEATRLVPLPELAADGLGRTIRVDDDRDLVVAEVSHRESGDWEVYARPTSRPTTGRRLQVTYGQDDTAEVVARPAEETAIREALAEYLMGPVPDNPQPAVHVSLVGDHELYLTVRAADAEWRVLI